MGNPTLIFDGKRVEVSHAVRLVSPFYDIPPYTMRFQFVDTPLCQSSSFDPTQGTGDEVNPYWKYGTWTHVTGNVYDWTYQDECWTKPGKKGSSTYYVSAYQLVTPTNDGTGDSRYATLWRNIAFKILGANLSNVKIISKLFYGAVYLVSVAPFDTSHVENAGGLFSSGEGQSIHFKYLTTLPSLDFSSINETTLVPGQGRPRNPRNEIGLMGFADYNTTLKSAPSLVYPADTAIDTRYMFYGCTALESASAISNLKCSYAEKMFGNCTSLTAVPLFDTSSCTHLTNAFSGCYSVESGALALYQQASTQATPPANHSGCFRNCGRDTVTGAAELAEIPTDWGGTYTPPSEG